MKRVEPGDKFGRLTVIQAEPDKILPCGAKEKYWLCKCDCGDEKVVREASLRSGNTKSCGCLRNEKSKERSTTHAMSSTKLYRVWGGMKRRCYRPYMKGYEHYGGKGIKVCDEWFDFATFAAWALENGYEEGLTIDRVDPDGDYCPENCRWVDRIVQNNHTSRNHMITFNGETLSMAEWARRTGISYNAIKSRLNKHGWSVERALTTPNQNN